MDSSDLENLPLVYIKWTFSVFVSLIKLHALLDVSIFTTINDNKEGKNQLKVPLKGFN